MQIPNELATAPLDGDLQEQIHTYFKPFDKDSFEFKYPRDKREDGCISESILHQKRNDIKKSFVIHVGDKKIILQEKRAEFDKEIKSIRKYIAFFQKKVQAELSIRIKESTDELTKAYLPGVLQKLEKDGTPGNKKVALRMWVYENLEKSSGV